MDLRVMSPTSYQTALPRDLNSFERVWWGRPLERLTSIAGYFLIVILSLKVF